MKDKSLLRQFIEIQHERWMTRRALRILSKQTWSVDFLTALLIRAANTMHRPLEMQVHGPYGVIATVRTTEAINEVYRDESIFNHLDDEMKVRNFINEINKK